MEQAKEFRPFGMRDKIGYLFGDFGNDVMLVFVSQFLMVFYTQVWGTKSCCNNVPSIKTSGCIYRRYNGKNY